MDFDNFDMLLFSLALVMTIAMGIASLFDGKIVRGWFMISIGALTTAVILWHRLN